MCYIAREPGHAPCYIAREPGHTIYVPHSIKAGTLKLW
jgi:hypothetical protein